MAPPVPVTTTDQLHANQGNRDAGRRFSRKGGREPHPRQRYRRASNGRADIQEDGTKRFAKDSRKEAASMQSAAWTPWPSPALVIGEGYARDATACSRRGVVSATVAALTRANLTTRRQALAMRSSRTSHPDRRATTIGHLEATQGIKPTAAARPEAAQGGLVQGSATRMSVAPGSRST